MKKNDLSEELTCKIPSYVGIHYVRRLVLIWKSKFINFVGQESALFTVSRYFCIMESLLAEH